MRGHKMIRQVDDGTVQGGNNAFDFLNKVQKVPYTLNTFITDVAKTLYDRGYTVDKFIPVWNEEPPPKPPNIDDDEDVRKAYRRVKAEWHNRQNDNAQRCVRTKRTMDAVKRHLKYPKFFLPWSYDYRGRAYPIPTVLTHQDTDFGKSLIKFYDQSPVTERSKYWLAFQVATTYGLDKSTMEDRQKWVKDNEELITRVTTDPIGNLHLWEKKPDSGADEPWLFLAACEEYYHCVIKQDRQYTNLPVAVDATCSGVQILAGLAKDASAAKLVNVLPSEKPQDAYQVVADALKPRLPEHLQPMMNRKIVKRCVMTIPYNAKSLSNRDYIREALKDEFEYDATPEDLTAIVKELRGNKEEEITGVMQEILPGPMAVMSWIERQVGEQIKSGKTELNWTSPSDFNVNQRFMKKETETVKLQLMGRVEMEVAVGDTDEVDLSHHKNATSPNLIHSLDASLLHLATLKFDSPISLIHDSVLCRSTDMDELSDLMRRTYMDIFAHKNYLQTWADTIGATEPPPMINTLRPELVIESTYFFC
jgi:DNA-directed RNA polymerase